MNPSEPPRGLVGVGDRTGEQRGGEAGATLLELRVVGAVREGLRQADQHACLRVGVHRDVGKHTQRLRSEEQPGCAARAPQAPRVPGRTAGGSSSSCRHRHPPGRRARRRETSRSRSWWSTPRPQSVCLAVDQPYSAARESELLTSSDVPPTAVTSGLSTGKSGAAIPKSAKLSPQSPLEKRTLTPVAAASSNVLS